MDPLTPSAHWTTEIYFHASGFLVRTQGNWTDGALAQFCYFLKLRHLEPTTDKSTGMLDQQSKNIVWETTSLRMRGEPRGKMRRPSSETGTIPAQRPDWRSHRQNRLPRTLKQAPVLALRIGDKQELFAEAASEEDWRAVLKFAKAAVHAKSLLVDAGAGNDSASIWCTTMASRAPI